MRRKPPAGREAGATPYGTARLTVWVPGEPGSGPFAVTVRDAVTGQTYLIGAGKLGLLEVPDGEGGWYTVWAARGDYEGTDGRHALVRMVDGALLRVAILWANQFFDGRRPAPWTLGPRRPAA